MIDEILESISKEVLLEWSSRFLPEIINTRLSINCTTYDRNCIQNYTSKEVAWVDEQLNVGGTDEEAIMQLKYLVEKYKLLSELALKKPYTPSLFNEFDNYYFGDY